MAWPLFILLAFLPCASFAQSESEVSNLYLTGDYERVIEHTQKEIEGGSRRQIWSDLLIRAQMATGQYPEAAQSLQTALEMHWRAIDLRLLGYDVMRRVGDLRRAEQFISEINTRYGSQPWNYRTADDLITLGRTAILLGADPRLVLDNLYDPAKQAEPENRRVHLAMGELALEKGDFALAAESFQEGLKQRELDPDFLFGLARSFAASDRGKMIEHIEQVLDINSNHTAAMVLLADHMIDAEDYEAATELLDDALSVNPWLPEAWSYKSVIANLLNQATQETEYRDKALHYWKNNPEVDHLIGRKLSQKYRFAEGSAHQKQALAFDPDYLPAKKQLANDLLRLGDPDQGWTLIEEVHARDGYDREAYNLVTLKDTLEEYTTLQSPHFSVRMKTDEARLFGQEVLQLLEEARDKLSNRYQVELEYPVSVEIFANQADFAVRTFGMPDNPGFLGVCFGPVITANSPSTQKTNPANWKAVLWHEFCHTITLHMTRNKMPRWISEGISVYEEMRVNPSWGQSMDANYVRMIEEGETPGISELSGAFLAPESSQHLDFAYFVSTMAVEYIVSNYGFPVLRQILIDLGEGELINDILIKRTKPLKELDKEFLDYVKAQAKAMAPELDFSKPSEGMLAIGDNLAQEIAKPNNYWLLLKKAGELMSAGAGNAASRYGIETLTPQGDAADSDQGEASSEFEEAKSLLMDLIKKYPSAKGVDSPHWLLANIYQREGRTQEEFSLLKQLAARDHDALPVYARLMEMGADKEDWELVKLNANRYLAVDPFSKLPYTRLLEVGDALKDPELIVRGCRGLLLLEPANPALVHFKMASALYELKQPGARQHTVMALEEAPRYVAAYSLLLEIQESDWEDPLVMDPDHDMAHPPQDSQRFY